MPGAAEDLAVTRDAVVARLGGFDQAGQNALTTTLGFKNQAPEVVQGMVRAFAFGAAFVAQNPEEASEIASRYIGVNRRFIREALRRNQPNVDALRNEKAMEGILHLMLELGYINGVPSNYMDLTFLDKIATSLLPTR